MNTEVFLRVFDDFVSLVFVLSLRGENLNTYGEEISVGCKVEEHNSHDSLVGSENNTSGEDFFEFP